MYLDLQATWEQGLCCIHPFMTKTLNRDSPQIIWGAYVAQLEACETHFFI
jgi:hypothetical protein